LRKEGIVGPLCCRRSLALDFSGRPHVPSSKGVALQACRINLTVGHSRSPHVKDFGAQARGRSGQPLRSFVWIAWSWCGALSAIGGWLDAVIHA
jgi:hypothetical protein